MNPFVFWTFAVCQIAIDIYIAGAVIYWTIQRKRYGTFNPLSPFQHRELQAARQLLSEFHTISQKTAHIVSQLHPSPAVSPVPSLTSPSPALAPRTSSAATSLTSLGQVSRSEPGPAPRLSPRPALLDRRARVRELLKEGVAPEEIRRQTGASHEEIHLLRAIS